MSSDGAVLETLVNKKTNHFIVRLRTESGPWMGYDSINQWQLYDQIVEMEHARGRVVTTGLGIGLLQTYLVQKPEVDEVVVYESSQGVINIFNLLKSKSDIDFSKLKIVNRDANSMKDEVCDCLFLDHYELEPFRDIADNVSQISKNNTYNTLWFWPAIQVYIKTYGKKLNCESFSRFVSLVESQHNIKGLFNNLDNTTLEYIKHLSTLYELQKEKKK